MLVGWRVSLVYSYLRVCTHIMTLLQGRLSGKGGERQVEKVKGLRELRRNIEDVAKRTEIKGKPKRRKKAVCNVNGRSLAGRASKVGEGAQGAGGARQQQLRDHPGGHRSQ